MHFLCRIDGENGGWLEGGSKAGFFASLIVPGAPAGKKKFSSSSSQTSFIECMMFRRLKSCNMRRGLCRCVYGHRRYRAEERGGYLYPPPPPPFDRRRARISPFPPPSLF